MAAAEAVAEDVASSREEKKEEDAEAAAPEEASAASAVGHAVETSEAAAPEEMEELAELQVIEEARLEQLFAKQKDERGLDDEVTLDTFFKLFDMWIQLYRLNKCEEELEKVVPICRRRGGQMHVRGVQALAFTVWKQGKFRQASGLFHEIEDIVGSSSALCENMGHTYSSLGDYDEASKYFKRALQCLGHEEKLGKKIGDRGGIMLGLGLIEDRLGRFDQALEACREAQRLFRNRAKGKPSSLVAKAGLSIAKVLLKLAKDEPDPAKRKAMEEEAVETERENVALFEVTCGDDSPLTASALKGLGEALMRREDLKGLDEAAEAFARSYKLEAIKDAFDLLSVMEVHNLLFSANMKKARINPGPGLDRTAFREYVPTIHLALERVRQMKQDANAGAYYKVAGEMLAFAEEYHASAKLLSEAVKLFQTEDMDKVKSLIVSSLELKEFCEKQVASREASTGSSNARAQAGEKS